MDYVMAFGGGLVRRERLIMQKERFGQRKL
jgi:hypothetical protein